MLTLRPKGWDMFHRVLVGPDSLCFVLARKEILMRREGLEGGVSEVLQQKVSTGATAVNLHNKILLNENSVRRR